MFSAALSGNKDPIIAAPRRVFTPDTSQRYNLRHMLDPQRTLEREAMLKRISELDAEIAQHERNMREGEARLPIEEQLSLKLRPFIEANIPELAGKLRVEIGSGDTQK